MSRQTSFQRARKPEEQELRRTAILTAAAELFDAEGEQGAGLSAIAAKAGFTKSNVYRYFESREQVLMSLFLDEFDSLVERFEHDVAPVEAGDLDALSDVATAALIARPRFAALLSIVASVLESNVSVDSILEMKRALVSKQGRIGAAIQSKLPGTTLADCSWAASMCATLLAGMWPNVTPSPAAAEIMAMPEFAHLKPVPDRDLKRAMRALLASIVPR